MAKPEGYRPKKLTSEELWNSVYQVVLKAALHNKEITVEQLMESTNKIVAIIKTFEKKEKEEVID